MSIKIFTCHECGTTFSKKMDYTKHTMKNGGCKPKIIVELDDDDNDGTVSDTSSICDPMEENTSISSQEDIDEQIDEQTGIAEKEDIGKDVPDSSIAQILSAVSELSDKLSKIEAKVDKVFEKVNICERREIKTETLDIKAEEVLKMFGPNLDITVLSMCYFDGYKPKQYPIKIPKSKQIAKLEYWLDNEWHSDPKGTYVKSIFKKNLQMLYISSNVYDKDSNNGEMFMSMQSHIMELEKPIVMHNILRQVIDKYFS